MAELDFLASSLASRDRMRKLVARLREDDYSRAVAGGWTVGALLAHLAHWDRFAAGRILEWQRRGYTKSSTDADAINAAEISGWLAMPGLDAARAALEAAVECDAIVAGVSPPLASEVTAAGRLRSLDRGAHRNEHIDEIERALTD